MNTVAIIQIDAGFFKVFVNGIDSNYLIVNVNGAWDASNDSFNIFKGGEARQDSYTTLAACQAAVTEWLA